MEERKENAPLPFVPQCEGSDQKEGVVVMPELSADFSKISLGNDQNSHDQRNQTPIDDLVEEEDEDGETQCGECGEDYTTDQFWIRCDYCEKWYHGKCVKITSARAEFINKFRCAKCSNKKKSARA